MNQKLLENNYLIIPNFISEERSLELAKEFEEYVENNAVSGDEQAPNSKSVYNYISFLELLCEKTPEVSSILGETVLPTYSYARVYKNKSELNSHTDRDACEISLTLHLNGDQPWPIWIKTPSGESKHVSLNPGDAMLYFGITAEHWRKEYSGENYTQVFLHYVRSRGNYSDVYFDNKNFTHNNNQEAKSSILVEKKIQDEVKTSIQKEKPQPKAQTYSPIILNGSSKLETFIQVFDDVMPEYVCDMILEEYENSNEWCYAETSGGINTNIRNCTEIGLTFDHVINNNPEIRKKIDNLIFDSVSKSIKLYKNICNSCDIEIDTGYQLLRYEKDQYYKQHTDSFLEQQRSLSCSINLNEDYIGGEFAFFDRDVMIRTKKGSAIVFPSNFMFPHEIMPVLEGTRYSIVTWLV